LNKKPKISIIVPVYNAEKYIETCIKSLIYQTYSDLEIIIVNDGSQDGSLEILSRYVQKDNRIKLLNQENSGVAQARNIGIENSIGEYLSFIDADDWVLLTLYQTFVNTLKRLDKNIDIWMFNASSYMPGNNDVVPMTFFDSRDWANHNDKDREHLFEDCMKPFSRNLSAANKIYRREFLTTNDIKFYPGLRYEDQYFSIKSFLTAKSIIFTDEILYRYRNYKSGSIMSGISEKVFDIFRISDLIEAEIEKLGLYESYKYALFQYKYINFFTRYMKCPEYLKQNFYDEMKRRLEDSEKKNLDSTIYTKLRDYELYELIKTSKRTEFDKQIMTNYT